MILCLRRIENVATRSSNIAEQVEAIEAPVASLVICPAAVANKYKWYAKRASPYKESRAELNECWRRLRRTERFELRLLLWKRYCLATRLFLAAVEHSLFGTEFSDLLH